MYCIHTGDIIYKVSVHMHVKWGLFNINVTDNPDCFEMNYDFQVPWNQSCLGFYKIPHPCNSNIPVFVPHIYTSADLFFSPAPCSDPHPVTRAN